jgi:hypothetical protein
VAAAVRATELELFAPQRAVAAVPPPNGVGLL